MFSLDEDEDFDLEFLDAELFKAPDVSTTSESNPRTSFQLSTPAIFQASTPQQRTSSQNSVTHPVVNRNHQQNHAENNNNKVITNHTQVQDVLSMRNVLSDDKSSEPGTSCDIQWNLDCSDNDFNFSFNEVKESCSKRDCQSKNTANSLQNKTHRDTVLESSHEIKKSHSSESKDFEKNMFISKTSATVLDRTSNQKSSDITVKTSHSYPSVKLLTSKLTQRNSVSSPISVVTCRATDENSPKVHSRRLKRKFPGPAGVLPKLIPGQVIPEDKITTDLEKTGDAGETTSLKVSYSQSTQVNDNSSWDSMKSDIGINLFKISQQHSIAKVIEKATQRLLVNFKIPLMCLILDSISVYGAEASAVFKDPSGDIKATLHRQIVKDYQMDLLPGSAIVLSEVGVFSPTIRKHYLNITLNNIIYIYNKRDGQIFRKDMQSIKICELLEQVVVKNKQFWTKIDEEKLCPPVMNSPVTKTRSSSLFSSPLANLPNKLTSQINQLDKKLCSPASRKSFTPPVPKAAQLKGNRITVKNNVKSMSSSNTFQSSTNALQTSTSNSDCAKNQSTWTFKNSNSTNDQLKRTSTAASSVMNAATVTAAQCSVYSDKAIAELLSGLEDEMMSDF